VISGKPLLSLKGFPACKLFPACKPFGSACGIFVRLDQFGGHDTVFVGLYDMLLDELNDGLFVTLLEQLGEIPFKILNVSHRIVEDVTNKGSTFVEAAASRCSLPTGEVPRRGQGGAQRSDSVASNTLTLTGCQYNGRGQQLAVDVRIPKTTEVTFVLRSLSEGGLRAGERKSTVRQTGGQFRGGE